MSRGLHIIYLLLYCGVVLSLFFREEAVMRQCTTPVTPAIHLLSPIILFTFGEQIGQTRRCVNRM